MNHNYRVGDKVITINHCIYGRFKKSSVGVILNTNNVGSTVEFENNRKIYVENEHLCLYENRKKPKIGSLVVITNSELYYCKKDSIGLIFETYKDGYMVKMIFGAWLECDDHKWFFEQEDFVEFEYNQHHRLLEQGEFIYSNVEYLDKQRDYETRVNNIRNGCEEVK